jgi:hypothetical protein
MMRLLGYDRFERLQSLLYIPCAKEVFTVEDEVVE